MAQFMDYDDSIKQNTKFKLKGLSEHIGSSNSSGHYTAHVLRNSQWYNFDDERFSKVSESTALGR